MEYRSVKGFTGLGQIGFLFAFLGLGFVLAGAAQAFFASQMLPAGASLSDTDTLMKAMVAPENVGLARLSQVSGTLLFMFLPAILWSIASHGKNPMWLGFSKHLSVTQIAIGFFIILSAAMVASPLADFSKYIVSYFPRLDASAKAMDERYNEIAGAMSNLKSIQEYIVALFIMAFFPAMFEEVFFRGALQNLLVRWWKAPMLGIIITSLLFSLIHGSIYLFLSRAFLGFALGLMFYKTKNIWINIIAHFLNNAIALTALYAYQKKTGKVDLEKIEPSVHWAVGLAGGLVLIGLFILLTKYSQKNKALIEAKENPLSIQQDPLNSFANHLS
jgi:uncharacterized protein